MVAEFLRPERDNAASLFASGELPIIDYPDTTKPKENHRRLRLLVSWRCHLLGEVPPDTEWFAVDSLYYADLGELLVLARCGLDDLPINNKLTQVVQEKAGQLKPPNARMVPADPLGARPPGAILDSRRESPSRSLCSEGNERCDSSHRRHLTNAVLPPAGPASQDR
jgi:hypothetical protein